MKIAVICANGKEGKLIVEEAIARGADVTAVVRGKNQSAAKKVIQKDLFDLNAADLKSLCPVKEAAEKVDTTAYIWYNIIIKYRRWYHG